MFVMMYCKSGSLLVCIASHGIFNALSVIASAEAEAVGMRIISAVLITLITGFYAAFLALSIKKDLIEEIKKGCNNEKAADNGI